MRKSNNSLESPAEPKPTEGNELFSHGPSGPASDSAGFPSSSLSHTSVIYLAHLAQPLKSTRKRGSYWSPQGAVCWAPLSSAFDGASHLMPGPPDSLPRVVEDAPRSAEITHGWHTSICIHIHKGSVRARTERRFVESYMLEPRLKKG